MNNPEKPRHKGVYLLPNLMTTGALFAGFYSIIAGINGAFVAAVIAVIVAGVLDGVDGRLARLTNTQSDFGTQYDSLSDLVSFGLAPALLMFNWSLHSLAESGPVAAKAGWLAAFLYAACAALRLARFNTQAGSSDKRYFQGLASPAAAGTMVSTIWFCVDLGIEGSSVNWLMLLVTVVLGLLMFSRVRYHSFKGGPAGDRIPLMWLFFLVLLLVVLAMNPPLTLFIVGCVYVGSGLLLTAMGLRQRRQLRVAARRDEAAAGTDEPGGPPST